MASRLLGRKSSSSGSSAKKPEAKSGAPSTPWFETLFDTYKDKEEDTINPEGIERLCQALELDPADVLVLVFAWKLEAKRMGYLTREEWGLGCPYFSSCSSHSELRYRLKAVYDATQRDATALRSLHSFTHKFCREEERSRNIEIGSALIMLKMLHEKSFGAHIKSISSFLEQNKALAKRGVSHDEWMMILQFCREVEPDCSNYQDDGAWPVLLDDYVEWYQEQHGKE